MAIREDQVAVVLRELMTSVRAAQASGIPCGHPGSVKFTIPIDAAGATVEFELRMDWYAGAQEDELWPTTTIAP